jgi:aspartate carbamoyltransferase catalytic subunit
MSFAGRDILAIEDFSREEILHVLNVAATIQTKKDLLHGCVMGSFFFEPSTRTRLSFESAMQRLGGSVIGFSDTRDTSLSKGESFLDTIRVVSGYCDVIVLRHPEAGSAERAARASKVPVINGGDGSNQHPTQTFIDLFTIKQALGRLDSFSIGFLGDLKYGRTVHSLASALRHFNAQMYFISPPSLQFPKEQLAELQKSVSCVEVENIDAVADKLDVVYATRIQQERFQFDEEFQKVKGCYKLDETFLQRAKKDVKILHPLPRIGEITHALDSTSNAVYFQQAHNGIPVRMALLSLVLGKV